MKDSRFSYTAVRIYSKDLIDKLEEAFVRTETSFASNRSEFLVHLIELGLASYQREVGTKRDNPIDSAFERPTDIDDFQDLLDEYITYSRGENEKSQEMLEICEGLASAIFNILVESLEGNFIDKEAAEAGKYDDLPKRFKKGNGKD